MKDVIKKEKYQEMEIKMDWIYTTTWGDIDINYILV